MAEGAWRRGGLCVAGGMHGRKVCMVGGGMHGRGVHGRRGACVAGKMAIAAGGAHPTAMHSCITIEQVYWQTSLLWNNVLCPLDN